jgi:hypothetical protein
MTATSWVGIGREGRHNDKRCGETWLAAARKTLDVIREDGTSDKAEPRLTHAHCRHRQGASGTDPALLPAHEP